MSDAKEIVINATNGKSVIKVTEHGILVHWDTDDYIYQTWGRFFQEYTNLRQIAKEAKKLGDYIQEKSIYIR